MQARFNKSAFIDPNREKTQQLEPVRKVKKQVQFPIVDEIEQEIEPEDKDSRLGEVSKKESADPPQIVSTITASIEHDSNLTSGVACDNVVQQQIRLPKIEEQNRLSTSEHDDRTSPRYSTHTSYTYMEPYDSLSSKTMSVVNVPEKEDVGSLRSAGSSLLVREMVTSYNSVDSRHNIGRDPDQSSILSSSSRVQAMVRGFNSLSRQNSDASNRESIYSRPDILKKVSVKNENPMSLADYLNMERGQRPSQTSGGSTPNVPPKEYNNFQP